MKCKHIEGLLSDYLDGRLRPALQARVAAHLQECAGCDRHAGELRQTLRLVSQLGRLRCPTDCRDAVLERISRPAAGWAPRLWSGWPTLWLRTGLAATAAACAVAFGAHFLQPGPVRELPPPVPAAVAVDPSEWHDLTRTEQARGATDSLVLTTTAPAAGSSQAH